MADFRVKLVGLDILQEKLKDNVTLDDVKRIVKENGGRLTREMKAQTRKAYVKGYSNHVTVKTILPEFRDGGLTVSVYATTDYYPYLEYGTRYMEAEPIRQPALDIVGPKFIRNLERVIEK